MTNKKECAKRQPLSVGYKIAQRNEPIRICFVKLLLNEEKGWACYWKFALKNCYSKILRKDIDV